MYKITLHDGTVLSDLTLNGNNYISDGFVEDTVFTDNLDSVTIEGDGITAVHTDMVLISNRVEDGRSWFVLGEMTAQEKAAERINKLLESNADDITDIQVALAEMYESMLMGGN